jgi:5-methylcytosine-specific restriction endonuclease McrA
VSKVKKKKKGVKKVNPVKKFRKQKEGECFFCGATTNLQHHHIIPKCIGGDKLENNKVFVCAECHKKLHILLDPVIKYMAQAILLLQEKLKKERTDLKAPLGFRGNYDRRKRK